MNVKCQYCGKNAHYVDSKVIYGKSYGMIYLCKPCRAYVGVHKGTDKPLGVLANAELREWKKKAHGSFDKLWNNRKERKKMYKWLSVQMGKEEKDTHIGMFSVEECMQVVEICGGD